MRVLVCGGRYFNDYAKVAKTLDHLHAANGGIVIIHGGATGADALAGQWAKDNQVEPEVYKADWDNVERPGAVIRYNRMGKPYDVMAGLTRNRKMLNEGKPDLVVAFAGGKGTAHMIEIAISAGVRTVRVI